MGRTGIRKSARVRALARAAKKAKAAADQVERDQRRPTDTAEMVASADNRRPSVHNRPPRNKSKDRKLKNSGTRQINDLASVASRRTTDDKVADMENELRTITVTEKLEEATKKRDWNNSWIGKLGYSYDMNKNVQLGLWTIVGVFLLGCALVFAKEIVMPLTETKTVTEKMTCSNTCRELIATALCHSKCVSVNRLAENIKGMRSCSFDTDIVESYLDDKKQWDERKRHCFAELDLGTLVCPRDVSVGEGGLNTARDLFECLRPSAFTSLTEQCVGLLKAMKC